MAIERVQKLISNAGFCSRRKAEEFIAQGKVTVNGHEIKLGDKADASKDEIIVAGRKIALEPKKYFAFYKPRFVLTTMSEKEHNNTILEYISNLPVRVFPVGRLDYDAEGLLILTNDGDFANKLAHPRYETSKTYEAELRDRIRDEDLKKLSGTIRLDDGPVKIESCKRLNEVTIEITIHEGRHKIVKRIFKDLGFYVKRLKRTKVGPFKLSRLKPGGIEELPKDLVKEIMEGNNKPERRKRPESEKTSTQPPRPFTETIPRKQVGTFASPKGFGTRRFDPKMRPGTRPRTTGTDTRKIFENRTSESPRESSTHTFTKKPFNRAYKKTKDTKKYHN